MITLEQVENLKKYADVSYEEARAALEASDGDLLEAVIFLEKNGKVETPKGGGSYTTSQSFEESTDSGMNSQVPPKNSQESNFKKQCRILWQGFCDLFRKGNINHFQVHRNEKEVLSVPVNILILSLMIFFWITLPLLVMGLFFGCSYKFRGPDLGKESINQMMGSATNVAENIKSSLRTEDADGKK